MRHSPRSDRPALRALLSTAVLGAALGGATLGLLACDRPCDRLQKRLEGCAAKEPLAKTYRDPRVKERLRLRCRRAEPAQVKACLSIKECDKLRACAAEAFADPADAR